MSEDRDRFLRSARLRGWLLVDERWDLERWHMLDLEWFDLCRQRGDDAISVYRTPEWIEVRTDLLLRPSLIGYEELEEWMRSRGDTRFSSWSDSVLVPGGEDPGSLVAELRELLERDRTPERSLELQARFPLLEGWALAVKPEQLWEGLEAHHLVYVRSLPGRPGRCMALRHEENPILDLPLSDFRILSSYDL